MVDGKVWKICPWQLSPCFFSILNELMCNLIIWNVSLCEFSCLFEQSILLNLIQSFHCKFYIYTFQCLWNLWNNNNNNKQIHWLQENIFSHRYEILIFCGESFVKQYPPPLILKDPPPLHFDGNAQIAFYCYQIPHNY